MRNTSTVVSPFYDSEPGVPLPLPPMLTDQLEVFGNADCRPTTLIADEILGPKASIVPTARASSSAPTPESKLSKRMLKYSNHSSSPYPKRATSMCSNFRTPPPSDSSSSLSSFSDSDSSTSSVDSSEGSKIPKPAGEPGRPGRGGYTLHEALDWNPRAYAKFKNSMYTLIEDHLDTTKCASAQSPALLKVMHGKALDNFPDLDNYCSLWPVNDMIMTRLKYTSGRARQKMGEMAAGKSKSKARK
ncbi:uncharacterized protein F5891DRAFT_1187918 [Suillus fuscotomentosus]|uniref:Uncharacterized protein n=1 Tax=Suillus fuscotomentosus TaxID=1912939 RepID=A0AAD4E7L9_9AGAM|nr:uncharacterized protein F5891DRAFT_1187918 [Suillus fuscotomentosus]KAG1901223.1 hypothetical protein F5891DRAFT_1187918 [Suillus fuscotomentosus]